MCYTYGMENFNINDFWNRVKYLCRVNRITKKDFAARCGVTEQNLTSQANIGRTPKITQTMLMAETLGVSIDYLITGKDSTQIQTENERLKEILAEIHSIASS